MKTYNFIVKTKENPDPFDVECNASSLAEARDYIRSNYRNAITIEYGNT